jgi:hypothetical protein
MDVVTSIGTVTTATVTANAGLGANAYEMEASGAFGAGYVSTSGVFRRNTEVVGDFGVQVRLADVDAFDPNPGDGFLVGLASMDSVADDAPSVLFGWGRDATTFGIYLRQRLTAGGACSVVATAAVANPRGVSLRMIRVGSVVTASYSLDAGATWIVVGTVSLARTTQTVGLFGNSGATGTATQGVLTHATLSNSATGPVNEFTILGGPDLVYVRSNSPHRLSLDGKTDPNAQAKVDGWAAEMKTRMSTAMAALMANPVPPAATNLSN